MDCGGELRVSLKAYNQWFGPLNLDCSFQGVLSIPNPIPVIDRGKGKKQFSMVTGNRIKVGRGCETISPSCYPGPNLNFCPRFLKTLFPSPIFHWDRGSDHKEDEKKLKSSHLYDFKLFRSSLCRSWLPFSAHNCFFSAECVFHSG